MSNTPGAAAGKEQQAADHGTGGTGDDKAAKVRAPLAQDGGLPAAFPSLDGVASPVMMSGASEPSAMAADDAATGAAAAEPEHVNQAMDDGRSEIEKLKAARRAQREGRRPRRWFARRSRRRR